MMLELENVSKRFGEKQVVASASLSVAAGDLVCLTGPSGIGKTTLLEMMAGVLPPDNGSITRQFDAAVMFQDDILIPWLNAEENITYILPETLSTAEASNITNKWLAFFGLEPALHPRNMSGGMRRRLSLARTFASGRQLMILDEPFAFLDETWQENITRQISAFIEKGVAIILASHTTVFLEQACLSQLPRRIFTLTDFPILLP